MNKRFDHPAWLTAFGTAVAYAVLLGTAFVVLFVLPYLAFATLGS